MNAYYSEEFLAEAIASVVSQTYTNWEIILWENESSDGTREIAESFNDPRIRYFFAPDKVSLYESRMNAFKESGGELVAFLDCDDLWMPEKLNIQIAMFGDTECVLSCSDYIVRNQNSGHKSNKAKETRYSTYSVPTASAYGVAVDYRVGMSTLVARRAVAEAVWPFPPPEYSIIEDFDMVLRLMTAGMLEPVREPLMVYRRHGKNFSSRLDIEIVEWQDFEQRLTEFGLTGSEEVLLKAEIRNRLLNMQCRQLRTQGRRREALKFAKLLPSNLSKFRLLVSLAIPRRLIRLIVSADCS